MLKRNGSAVWTGGLKDGTGVVTGQSGAFKNLAYSFATRFEDTPGTNPEELIAAAHAGCFSMALSSQLGQAGFAPESIETTATLNFEQAEGGWSTTSIHLDTSVKAPGVDQATVKELAEKAKEGCPVSRLLNTKITLSAKLV